MPDILDYLEYREFLRDWFIESKKENRFTSYRYLGQKTGVDPAWLVRVFQKEGHLNEEALPAFIRLCSFDDRRAEYFRILYRFCKTKAKASLSELYCRLMELREMEARVLTSPEFMYFGNWACTALRALVGISQDTSDLTVLANHLNPPISQKDAHNALEVLKQLKLIEPDGHGEVKSRAVRDFHRRTLELAQESLDRHSVAERDVSSIVFTVDEADIPEFKQRIEDFRRGLLQFAKRSENANRVYALNVSMFPLSDVIENPASSDPKEVS
jgi:uncharacterized protein (TIGR02147 family)